MAYVLTNALSKLSKNYGNKESDLNSGDTHTRMHMHICKHTDTPTQTYMHRKPQLEQLRTDVAK